ncbi:hypothetical protein A8L44_00755 [Bacillus sp. FJAT-27986]|nr:hypothetical protein A8L44_00755 [Bacillus sp. FJAT-27986]
MWKNFNGELTESFVILFKYNIMRKEGDIVCAQKKYNELLNELRKNYQMYYDNRSISHKDFYKRRVHLIMKLRTLDINEDKSLISDISNYSSDFNKHN